ncbi:MAG: putative transcriptional regulator [Actinomycetia bacterium]|nr:putative transcriptional regulator [Actinomycetes bacterium]
MAEDGFEPASASNELSADEFSAAISAVTNAFGDPTRREIYLFVRSSEGGVRAGDVAEHFELHPNVARHHLEKLSAGGYLRIDQAPTVARSAGRPSKVYVASPLDHSLNFPPRRDDLMATLLARALELLPPEQAGKMADEVGFEYGRVLASRMSPAGAVDAQRSVKAALATVADALTAHGFAAHSEARGNGLAIIAEHCPFGEAAQQFPHVVCAVDRGMIRGMLSALYGETDPHFEESRPEGDAHCVVTV